MVQIQARAMHLQRPCISSADSLGLTIYVAEYFSSERAKLFEHLVDVVVYNAYEKAVLVHSSPSRTQHDTTQAKSAATQTAQSRTSADKLVARARFLSSAGQIRHHYSCNTSTVICPFREKEESYEIQMRK